MRAAVASIGSELLRGDIVDTNAAFLAQGLTALGFDVCRVSAAGDDLEDLTQMLRDLSSAAEVVVCTGGLGPTEDDLTRDAIAAIAGEEQYQDPDLVRALEERFSSMRRHMPASNFRQANLIPSAEALPNPNGTAPGWYAVTDGRIIAALPGPPHEMRPMWSEEVRPRLQSLLQRQTVSRALMTFGIGESAAEERIADVIHWRTDVTVATYAKAAGVQVHITARGASLETAECLADEAESRIRERLGIWVYGRGDDTLAEAVGRLLDATRTVSVMESATGGLLGDMLTSVDGSSDHFLGGIIAYSVPVKEQFGVDSGVIERHGVVSAETAAAMASAVRTVLRTDIGLSVTGIAGRDSVEGKPAGTCFIGLDVDGFSTAREVHRPATRRVAKQFFAHSALDLLRRYLLGALEDPE